MERALAVVEASEQAKRLVGEAGELAAGVDAELVLLHVTTEEEFTGQNDALASIPDFDTGYSVENARDGARQFAADVGSDALADVDVEFEAVGRLGDPVERVLDAAQDHDCDHLFIAGRRRSPAGKALFGDVAQRVILDFEEPVTVMTGGR